MTDNITNARIRKYAAGIMHLSQQRFEVMRGMVSVDTDVKAKMTLYDQMGTIELEDKTSRHQPTPNNDIPHPRRALFTSVKHAAILVDEADLDTVLNDPTSDYGVALAMGAARAIDLVAIKAFDAVSKVGEDGQTDQAFTAANIIGGAGAMTTARAIEAKKILDQGEVDVMIPRWALFNAEGMEDLLSDSQVVNKDTNTIAALVHGNLDTWLGFTWKQSERLQLNTAGTERKSLMWAHDGMKLGLARDINVRVGERPDLSYDDQVYISVNVGATRMEEKKCVVVENGE